MSDAYKQAGVDIEAGNQAVERMKSHVKRTMRPGVLSELGGFGGMFGIDKNKYDEPVLVSGTDGVGTKLKLAFQMDKHDTIGIDAVAMCVNDIIVQGAEPLFFLDYLACGKVVPEKIEAIVAGIAEGCVQSNCALVGGETAEMPGLYDTDEYDIAGFAVGIAEKRKLITGAGIQTGDVVLGLPSSGLHSNGYSLVRKLLLEDAGYELDAVVPELGGGKLGDVLLTPTRIYVKQILHILSKVQLKGLVHVTGGGFVENIPRVLPAHVNVDIERGSWKIPPIFDLLQHTGNLSDLDMYRTFNMGIGMIIVVQKERAASVISAAQEVGEEIVTLGKVTLGDRKVTFDGVELS